MPSSAEPLSLPGESEDALLPLPEIIAPDERRPARGFAKRELVGELMDDPAIDEARHFAALRGLARLNRISGSVGHVWRSLVRLARREGLTRLSVVDVATGSGDVPIALARLARRAGLELNITGIDVSAQATEFSRRSAEKSGEAVDFVIADVLTDELPGRFDVAICSLFLHHLTDAEAIRVLCKMNAAATRMGLVNDLVRSRLAYLQVWAASQLVSRSPIVHLDGLASVRAAFTIAEARDLATRAGLSGVEARRAFPCRYLLSWKPSS